jgi:hypothetical protein
VRERKCITNKSVPKKAGVELCQAQAQVACLLNKMKHLNTDLYHLYWSCPAWSLSSIFEEKNHNYLRSSSVDLNMLENKFCSFPAIPFPNCFKKG